jgi:hypothetical protein
MKVQLGTVAQSVRERVSGDELPRESDGVAGLANGGEFSRKLDGIVALIRKYDRVHGKTPEATAQGPWRAAGQRRDVPTCSTSPSTRRTRIVTCAPTLIKADSSAGSPSTNTKSRSW